MRSTFCAREIQDQGSRLEALAALAPHLTLEERDKVFEEAVAPVAGVDNGDALAVVLKAALASRLAPNQKVEALAAAKGLDDAATRARTLAGLAPFLAPELCEEALRDALAAANTIDDAASRAITMTALVPFLALQTREEAQRCALTAVRAIRDPFHRREALAKLVLQLTREQKDGVLNEAFVTAEAFDD